MKKINDSSGVVNSPVIKTPREEEGDKPATPVSASEINIISAVRKHNPYIEPRFRALVRGRYMTLTAVG